MAGPGAQQGLGGALEAILPALLQEPQLQLPQHVPQHLLVQNQTANAVGLKSGPCYGPAAAQDWQAVAASIAAAAQNGQLVAAAAAAAAAAGAAAGAEAEAGAALMAPACGYHLVITTYSSGMLMTCILVMVMTCLPDIAVKG